jgi:hypothetical protein
MKSQKQTPYIIGAMIVLTLLFSLPSKPMIAFEMQQAGTPDGCVTVVDTLGIATTQTQFLSAGGTSILPTQFVGPRFTLTQSAVLSEIGGFINHYTPPPPQCANPLPFVVQIRPQLGNSPDPNTIIASFTLSDDNDPSVWSYESVSVNLALPAGTYFAVFAPQTCEQGAVLGQAFLPFSYIAGSVPMGVVYPQPCPNCQTFSPSQFLAVRILANCTLEVSIDIKPGGFPNSINLRSRGKVPVAILSTETFDATSVDPASVLFAGAPALSTGLGFEDVNGDGRLDLIVHFNTSSLNLTQSAVEACVTGQTFEGQTFTGCDSVRILR